MPRKNELNPNTIGYRIRQLREDMDLSQEELAKLVRSNKNTVSLIESGKQDLYYHQIQEYAKVLNTSAYFLTEGVHPENLNIATELDLTDSSISFLKAKCRKVKKEKEEEDVIIVRNEYKTIIDILTHNPTFVEHLYRYFCRYDFATVVYKDDPFEDGYTDYESLKIKDIVGFPFEDLERVYRLQLLDELKTIRDSFEAERNRIHAEAIAHDREAAKKLEEYYHSISHDDNDSPKQTDEEYYQEMFDNLLSQMIDQKEKEENENGND